MNSRERLKAIRFAGELLPHWAQLLDLAARLCFVSEEACHWFTVLTTRSGVDDSRTVVERCKVLQAGVHEHGESIRMELRRDYGDTQPARILDAWLYALDTMLQEARTSKTCSWIVEGADDEMIGGPAGGDITLRRV